jgi:phage baseplate assembly protein W
MTTTAPGETDYGTDLSGVDDLDENMVEVSGMAVLQQALARRLITRNGMLLDDPTYGYDVREELSSAVDRTRAFVIAGNVKAQCLLDPRVLTCDVQVEIAGAPSAQKVKLRITGVARQGEFDLVVEVDKVTATLLATGGA